MIEIVYEATLNDEKKLLNKIQKKVRLFADLII